MSNLSIHIITHGNDSSRIPKKITILNSKLEEIDSFWMTHNNHKNLNVESGVYGVALTLASGKKMEKAVMVKSNLSGKVTFDLSGLSPYETQEWAYLSKNLSTHVDKEKDLVDNTYLGAWIRLWKKEDENWKVVKIPIQESSSWNEEGVSYELNVERDQQFLQVGGPKIPWKLIALPPNNNLMCLIRPNEGPKSIVHPLEVTVTSDNWFAETILTLLNQDSRSKAQDLYDSSGLKSSSAEELLYGKISNPTAAAIGGYYLLKTGEIDRLHNWAENLANWMPWMSDGSIIWAWQLIKEGRNSGNMNIIEIKSRFLEATKRGIPLYTEGLRLLWKGLKMLVDNDTADSKIEAALKVVEKYAEAADWTTTTTTFNGVAPQQPGKKSKRGTPHNKDFIAYIYDVPVKELIKDTVFDPIDDNLEIYVGDSVSPGIRLASDGWIRSDEGMKFGSIYKAAKELRSKGTTSGSMDEKLKDIHIKFPNKDFDSEIRKYRMGKGKL
ncbi:hypothetical protein [uncultured Aquimarina sp.]|uniref:hypothetical protein n=1 Tax=uncultured Aquimarina sp. TaxID=575652 RepID=UPI00260242E5|nr:hypothetical protein [uncultured Aquimarina sp.]